MVSPQSVTLTYMRVLNAFTKLFGVLSSFRAPWYVPYMYFSSLRFVPEKECAMFDRMTTAFFSVCLYGHLLNVKIIFRLFRPTPLQALVEKGLDHTEGTDMEGTLADPVKIRQWQVRGETTHTTHDF